MNLVSECSLCPGWVLRCAHFDGQAVYLRDWWVKPDPYGWVARYHVCGAAECVGFGAVPSVVPSLYLGDDLDAALAVFNAAARELVCQ